MLEVSGLGSLSLAKIVIIEIVDLSKDKVWLQSPNMFEYEIN